MFDETIAAILSAFRDADGNEEALKAALGPIVDHAVKGHADVLAGTADTTAGLKATLEKFKATAAERGTEVETLRQQLESAKRQAEAQKAGLDGERVEAMAREQAQEMAAQMSADAIRAAESRADEAEARANALQEDSQLLLSRLETSHLDRIVDANGGDKVDELLRPRLVELARNRLRIRQPEAVNGEDQVDWWRASDRPEIDVLDETGKSVLQGKKGPMTPADFLAQQQAGPWASLYKRADTGPGGSSVTVGQGGKVNTRQMSGTQMLEAVLSK